MTRQLRREEYAVGWVCALPVELAAAQEMLDEEHETPLSDAHDTNIYTCGRVGEHNVVIACLPEGQTGTHSAAAVAVQMGLAFTSTRFGLMVGIGGGVPSEEADIRLGDVVVSMPHKVHGGVVQYDSSKATPSGFERTGSLNTPPTVLLSAVANLRAKHMRGRGRLAEYLSKLDSLPDFTREAAGPDALYHVTYNHEGGATCRQCDKSYLAVREPRRQDVVVHYGTIASGNQVMRSAAERDKVSEELGGVLCFEMEAAGLINSFPCLVIRGICEYADSHKNRRWQAYAAATAAAYAKELLSIIPFADVVEQKTMRDAIDGPDDSIYPEQPELNAALADLARGKNKRLNWQESVVDLLKVLDLNCGIRFREWLAESLHIRAGPSGSKKQNNALRKAIVWELAAGEVEWQEETELRWNEGRCLNCGRLGHWKNHCATACGKCLYPGHKASECGYPVRCIYCRKLGHMTKYCSYADSHKNKRWQPYAVATPAAWAKEVLSVMPPAEVGKTHTVDETVREASAKATYCIPFTKNRYFVGRQDEIRMLQQKLIVDQDCHQLSIVGLGGTGKTQIALQFAYSVKERWPEYSVLWVPALSMESFEQACVGIAEALRIPQAADEEEDVKEIVQQHLSSSRVGRWLLVVDNADDADIFFGTEQSKGIIEYLPKSEAGVVMYTTRNPEIAELTRGDVVELGAMDRQDAAAFLEKLLTRKGLFHDDATTTELLAELTCLPLAITQAAAYLNRNRMSFQEYLWLLRSTEQDVVALISREFRDDTRYKGSANAVIATWMVSFNHIRKREHLDRLASQHELAGAYEADGQVQKAVQLLEHVVSVKEIVLVEEHPDRLASQHALAIAYEADGQLQKAVELLEHVVAVREKVLAEEHPSRLASQHALAVAYEADGQLQKAVELLERVVVVREKVLAEEHPSRLASQHALAVAYEADGQVQKAVELLKDVVAVRSPGKEFLLPTAVDETSLHARAEAYRSTQADSTVGSTTLVDTQDEDATELNYCSSLREMKQEVLTDEDCISVESNDEDIASRAAIRRTEPEILAVRQFGSFFAELEELRPLHEEALVRLGTQRFQENYRRILKLYVLKLQNEAHIAVEKDTVSVLKSRMNRLNIAQRIVALIQGDGESSSKPMDGLTHQPVEKIHLEKWAKNVYALRNAENTKPIEEEYSQSGNECDSDVDTDEHRPNELRFPSITQATAFLRRGSPFQELVHELRLLVLPVSIREVIACTRKHAIHISSVNDTSLMNKIKAFAEDHSAFEWDWWPLMPRIPDLPPGRLRLQWTFCEQHLFKVISLKEAESIQRALAFIGDHPFDCSCCETMTVPATWTTTFHRICQSVARMCHRETLSFASTTQESSSKAQQLYTPASMTASIASSAYTHSPTKKTPPIFSPRTNGSSGTQAQGGCPSANPVIRQRVPSWVVFGVQNTHDFDEIENIEMTSLLDDPSFFQELKTRHNKHRWLFQRWFSPFRFRYFRDNQCRSNLQ
ncbi:hypothetical protein CC80DRAFT_13282 [Byssothecium circinans]|uniref:CCHC-type domain-containing protein n=1 Tax=Byssothecium circinans TaxID=147558 RepID=A0A6A5UFV2_9PLEO|nr:hypothetical protein CC80DRAFT_13282 [Byssothecium circinans]